MELGGQHPITGRQWQLTDEQSDPIWPDACIVVPFGAQVADGTGKNIIVNPVPGQSDQGGWTVTHTLEKLELWDLVQNQEVSGVTAVWATGPGGDTPALHVLGDNPFTWLTPHLDVAASATTTAYPLLDQWFGAGPAQQFAAPRRFGEVVITPDADRGARLLASPLAWLPKRMLQARGARLSFSYPSGLPIYVDRLWLGVLVGVEELEQSGWVPDQSFHVFDDWWFAFLKINVPSAGAHEVDIEFGGSILFVRYRHRALTVTAPERITLQPGHYRLTLSGTSAGTKPTEPKGMEDAPSVAWSKIEQDFWVDHPPSLRPYVRFSTIGDDRLFGPKPGFDPTLAGVGFPAHRDYLPVVRFCVPYIKAKGMFPKLKFRLDYWDRSIADITQEVEVKENADNESTLPDAAVNWKTAHGGSVPPDDEVVMTAALPGPDEEAEWEGDATLHLRHVPATGEEFELDSWAVYISRFANAAAHLSWPGRSITRYYRSDGPHDRKPCPTIGERSWRGLPPGKASKSSQLDPTWRRLPPGKAPQSSQVDLPQVFAGTLLLGIHMPVGAMPAEYESPPDDWPLPAPLASLAQPLYPGPAGDGAAADSDVTPSQRFLLFLWRSGVRLSADAAASALAGAGTVADATSVEAICDDQDRPFALWLRTPEPLDWRRVHAEMTVSHVEPDKGCPTSYANRPTLDLTIDLLPSTDGSSALLIAGMGGKKTRLPRGEITLRLRYKPDQLGIVKLRPRTPLPSGHEEITLTFLQPLGQPWPTKPEPSGLRRIGPRIPELVEKGPPFPPRGPGPLRDLIEHLRVKRVGGA